MGATQWALNRIFLGIFSSVHDCLKVEWILKTNSEEIDVDFQADNHNRHPDFMHFIMGSFCATKGYHIPKYRTGTHWLN